MSPSQEIIMTLTETKTASTTKTNNNNNSNESSATTNFSHIMNNLNTVSNRPSSNTTNITNANANANNNNNNNSNNNGNRNDIESQVDQTLSQLLNTVETSTCEDITNANIIGKIRPNAQSIISTANDEADVDGVNISDNHMNKNNNNDALGACNYGATFDGSTKVEQKSQPREYRHIDYIDDTTSTLISTQSSITLDPPNDSETIISTDKLSSESSQTYNDNPKKLDNQIDKDMMIDEHDEDTETSYVELSKVQSDASFITTDDINNQTTASEKQSIESSVKRKRPRNQEKASSSVSKEESIDESNGRAKRRRTQTKLFQAGEPKSNSDDQMSISSPSPSPVKKPKLNRPVSSKKKKQVEPIPKARVEAAAEHNPVLDTQNLNIDPQYIQDVIHYEKNDYLAIRNEQDSFYLCQLTHTVKSARPTMTVRWLDTEDDGKTYYLTAQQDKIPQKSVIMPVDLIKLKSEKKGEQLFSLADEVKEVVMERLLRSIVHANHGETK